MVEAGRITSIYRYPVKSMGGERMPTARLGELGLHADRTWAVRDVERKMTTSAKRLPGLLMCTARYTAPPDRDAGPDHAPEVIIGLPDGREVTSSDPAVHRVLSEFLDTDVVLTPLPPLDQRGQYRAATSTQADMRTVFGLGPEDPLPDLSVFPVRKLVELSRYATPVGSYVDAYPVHVMTEQSLRSMSEMVVGADFDVRRFRPTILVDAVVSEGLPELTWCGGVLRGQNAALTPVIPTIRCVMPSHPQPGLPRNPEITRTIAAHARRCLGVYATVLENGQIAEGEVLQLDSPRRAPLAAATRSTVRKALVRAVSAALPRGRS